MSIPTGSLELSGSVPQRGRRLLADALDFGVLVLAGVGLAVMTYLRVGALLTSIPGLALTGIWSVLSSHGADMVPSIWHTVVRYVLEAFGLLVLFGFLYQLLAIRYAGRTLGKAALDLKVMSNRGGRVTWSQAAVRAGTTAVVSVLFYAIACWTLMDGFFTTAFYAWLLAVAVLLADVLVMQVGPRRSLEDFLARTRVESGTTYTRIAVGATRGAAVSRKVAVESSHRVSDLGRAGATRVHDAATGDRAAAAKAKAAASRKVAVESSRRVSDLGRAGATRVHDAATGDRAAAAKAMAAESSRQLARFGRAKTKQGMAKALALKESYQERQAEVAEQGDMILPSPDDNY